MSSVGSKGVAWRKGRAGLGQSEKGEPVAGCSCKGEECLGGWVGPSDPGGLVLPRCWNRAGVTGSWQPLEFPQLSVAKSLCVLYFHLLFKLTLKGAYRRLCSPLS